MSISTISSSALCSWTSESDVESDYDATIIFGSQRGQLGIPEVPKKRELGDVAMTGRFCLGLLDKWCRRKREESTERVDLQGVGAVGKDVKSGNKHTSSRKRVKAVVGKVAAA